MKNKILYLIALLMAFIFILTGCSGDIDGKYKGFSSGFNYGYGGYTPIECAARSEKTEFNIDDVALDFYVGWYKEPPSSFIGISENSLIVLYFCKIQRNIPMYINNEIDYRNVDGLHCMGNIPMDEFCSDKYAISMTKKLGKTFEESTKLTIPRELFDEKISGFVFLVTYVAFSEEDNTYSGSVNAFMVIECEYIDDSTVHLIRSYHK